MSVASNDKFMENIQDIMRTMPKWEREEVQALIDSNDLEGAYYMARELSEVEAVDND